MGTSKWVGARYALVTSHASAFCDEIVEVVGELKGQNLTLIETGKGLWWEASDRLSPALKPVKPPCAPHVAREVYCEVLGGPPPLSASPALVWATICRKLDEIGWEGLRLPLQINRCVGDQVPGNANIADHKIDLPCIGPSRHRRISNS